MNSRPQNVSNYDSHERGHQMWARGRGSSIKILYDRSQPISKTEGWKIERTRMSVKPLLAIRRQYVGHNLNLPRNLKWQLIDRLTGASSSTAPQQSRQPTHHGRFWAIQHSQGEPNPEALNGVTTRPRMMHSGHCRVTATQI